MSAAPHTGTTIVAVTFAEGVVIGADSRVTTGTYVSNRASDKLTALDAEGFIFLGRSGSAADTQLVADYVRYYIEQHSMETGSPPSVHTTAKLAAEINYQNKKMLSAAMLVAGWDALKGGQVYGVPISGTLVPERWSTDGSGSTYIWGFLDSEYREGMSQEEAEKLVAEALALAMSRDGSSGGLVRLATITKAGCTRQLVKGDEQPTFWDELPAPPKLPPPSPMVEA